METEFLVEQLENCQKEADDILSELEMAKSGKRIRLKRLQE